MAENNNRSWLSSLAAVGSVAAASLCCLPVLPLTLAAGGAGAAWLTASKFQPYLIGLSAAFIGYGFWQASRAKHCSLPRKGLNFGLLTLSALLTAGVVLFPQAIANRLTGIPQQIAATTAARIHSADAVREAFDAAPADTLKIVALYSPT